MEADFGGVRLRLVQGDITRQDVDAVVNAANSSLMGGGGVDGAIHRAGGPAILDECRELRAERGKLSPGDAVATTGGKLNAKWVIHTVGPVYRGGGAGEARILASAYRRSLEEGAKLGAKTVAFPSISTGVFGYPLQEASRIALATVKECVAGKGFEEVRFVLFSPDDLEAYAKALEELN